MLVLSQPTSSNFNVQNFQTGVAQTFTFIFLDIYQKPKINQSVTLKMNLIQIPPYAYDSSLNSARYITFAPGTKTDANGDLTTT